jgi:RNA polymerase sigma-70 factor (ECF subfamily)
VVVHRKLSQFSARSSVRTWVYGIAARSASEYRRRGHVKRESADGEPAQQVAEPAQLMTIERREARAHLDAIIDQLDEAKRAVFVLFELEELPMAEVADALSCPLQTAYSRLHAARREVEAAVKRLELKERMR